MGLSTTVRAARLAAGLAAGAGLAGCGDGNVRLAISINFPAAPQPGQAVVVLSGSASLPEGSVRTGGTATVPWVSCQPGPYTMGWTNESTGAQGTPVALWNCSQSFLSWSTGGIPLAPGTNRITITITDSRDSGRASLDVTR